MIKLLAIDLDDTCLNWNNKIKPSTMCALKKAAASGVEIVFVTGRPYESLPHQLTRELFFRYVITSNGACIVDRKTGEVVRHSYIPQSIALPLLRQAKEQKLGVTVHMDQKYFMEGRRLLFLGKLLYGKDGRGFVHVKDMAGHIERHGDKIEEIHLFFLRKNKRRSIAALKNMYPHLYAPVNRLCAEFLTASTTKGNALEWLYRRLGLDWTEVACIGDGENDIPMFKKSGLRFAVENAHHVLKAMAHFIVPSNDKNGVGIAAEQILQTVNRERMRMI